MRPKTTKNIMEAMEVGKIVADPVTWKNNTTAVNAIASVLTLVIGIMASFGFDLPISNDATTAIAGFLWSGVGVFNIISIAVTSAKVGTKKRRDR